MKRETAHSLVIKEFKQPIQQCHKRNRTGLWVKEKISMCIMLFYRYHWQCISFTSTAWLYGIYGVKRPNATLYEGCELSNLDLYNLLISTPWKITYVHDGCDKVWKKENANFFSDKLQSLLWLQIKIRIITTYLTAHPPFCLGYKFLNQDDWRQIKANVKGLLILLLATKNNMFCLKWNQDPDWVNWVDLFHLICFDSSSV